MLYSAGMAQSGARFLSMQLVWGGLGLMACFAATVMDYRWFKKIAFPLFIFTLILLVLVLIPGIGLKLNGARRWFDLGPMNFQPSELAKISLLMALALWGERHVVRPGGGGGAERRAARRGEEGICAQRRVPPRAAAGARGRDRLGWRRRRRQRVDA